MSSDRFHKAARDGLVDLLREATRRDCNAKDEDGMTPTLWAAFEGKLEALRLIVGRGGDPDRCDNFGNTALHFAASRGHMACVSFLVHFGVNLWALDIDFHTPKELAAMNNRDEILRYLDGIIAREESTNRKIVKQKKEKAQKEAEKRARDFHKIQKKAEKLAAKEQERLLKERKKMEKKEEDVPVKPMPHRPSTALLQHKQSSTQSPKFSEIVSGNNKKASSAVYKKVQQRKAQTKPTTNGVAKQTSDFKVRGVEDDGTRSVRSLSGLRRDSEIMYVGTYDSQGKRGRISDVFETDERNELSRTISEPDFGLSDGASIPRYQETGSIFDRPGFGSVAFRNSITATLSALPGNGHRRRGSLGSAGSHGEGSATWDELASNSGSEYDEGTIDWSALQLFLAASGLSELYNVLTREQVDLKALMLLTEEDFKAMGIPMGPRRKLMYAVEERRSALEDPGEVEDSRL